MNVILKKDVPGLGKAGDVKTVAEGYAKNFLFPKDLVLLATTSNIKSLEDKKKQVASFAAKEKSTAIDFAERLKGLTLTVKKKAGEGEKLFGSVSTDDIVNALMRHKLKVEKKMINHDPIKSLGEYTASIKLYQGISATVKIMVERE
ncbi:50S ribosomal protein L9 [Candidatus Desantisbacteria bacterium CG2_30_40_21]|uniref:Large ribosomal subunit protein bL9 n=4 Tax=unclassified Candidatus Desantisiibacteriota TaxID=3106372 RepID=A0A2M7JCU7_9BACT|nr:MAG: 50S ribosomal protein L9 [Candidatus Desantisbacteria bacterium CG2_30_40_21]PIP41609.1 MAG: 50S ribosomal protein L9 [Candidatus Desantisbacteria bacterium CG23_combo_of_CG06-09_8_20_14_all_40_23]PIX17218.1 MAG: 50S ribosomal protein L9 [Candidatus Desantisbacteria bacterium CG_4_8_14_3_um_filter_40_12]PJB29810.1 MAG: 50S ribosomal protein L9 [Candidatus Desantisbacteria bacterium CG_4_9_14_3_um_filter_40_11]